MESDFGEYNGKRIVDIPDKSRNELGMESFESQQIEKIDYLMDDVSIQKLFKSLGQPQTCPHGKPVISK